MAMSLQRTSLLGLFFLVALGLLAYYTLFQTDFRLFGKDTRYKVHFSEANGLRQGDSVLVAGVRWGKVKKLEYNPGASNDRRIVVTLSLTEDLVLREGFSITIQDATLLGGKNVSIDPGPADGAYVPRDTLLFGRVGKNPLASLGELVAESQKGVSKIIEDLSAITAGIRDGKGAFGRFVTDPKMADDLAEAMRGAARSLVNLDRITGDMVAGRGSAGQLLTNRELYDQLLESTTKLNGMLDQTTGIIGDFRAGKGMLPRLFQDETMAAQFASTVAKIDSIVTRVEAGQGTVGVLLKDDAFAQNVTSITDKIARGEGTLGALLTKDEVYENIRETTENIAVASSAVRNGQGSLGRLVMNDEIYQQVKTALLIVQKALEEYREAAPVTTFTSVFFGAF
jgi:phospholipid/cholesterol/gamma-HCH transport system substrate-binding protein